MTLPGGTVLPPPPMCCRAGRDVPSAAAVGGRDTGYRAACRGSGSASGIAAIAHEFVERDCPGVRDIDRRLLAAGRQTREVIAALAHEPSHAASLGAEHERHPLTEI